MLQFSFLAILKRNENISFVIVKLITTVFLLTSEISTNINIFHNNKKIFFPLNSKIKKKSNHMKQLAITAAVVIVALAIYGKFLKSKIEA